MKRTTRPACNTSEADSGPAKLSVRGLAARVAMSLSLRALAERLGDHADILYARLPQGVHHGCPTAERNCFIAANVHRLMLRVFHLRKQLPAEVVDIYRLVVQVDALRAVDGDDHAHLRQLFHGFRFRDVYFDSGLQNRRG